ncbi:FSR family fosmidomycin resistance protein-like MFS transporter [Roseiarcus fermentans]|uniref:FSR family fosmidomycin resistance protein-like MFS transporter n=1 Tax=Roseiarcus fermentans TaxID=1473586 RepID=A0A366EWE1_9HYPH|nr:MFS transporter [Roseiarcus fermentans]RBP06236.1 FSR family fosmidomycin resistance protein-like MFS transporter [Roseiarcus fermentans]
MTPVALARRGPVGLALPVLLAASVCHFLNDATQSLFTASYPIFRSSFDLSFAQIGLLTLAYQLSASILQPLIGLYTDRHPAPYSLPVGMGISAAALVTLAFAPTYPAVVAGAALLGVGSSIFHPESSRLARLASGGAHGLAQSIFQVGGNIGASVGPLLVVFFVLPGGQSRLAWFAGMALCGIAILTRLGQWYSGVLRERPRAGAARAADAAPPARVGRAMAILAALIFSKYFYIASFTSYYVFYLEQRFQTTQRTAQMCLFVFLGAVALGTLIGGPVGDRIGRKTVIWGSILGILPFALVLPYATLPVTIALSAVIGVILASAFSAIVVYAQELMPHRIGMVSGLFFGLAFGMAGLGAAVLGVLADATSIVFVYRVCAFLPLIGMLAALLPETRTRRAATRGTA